MTTWLDYIKGTANKVKNSALYNALTGNKDDEITFAPLQPKADTQQTSSNTPSANDNTQKLPLVQLDTPEEDKLATQQYIENEQKAARENPTAGMSKWDKIMYNMGYKNQPSGNLSLYERLVGQQAKPTDSTEQTADGTLKMTVSENPRTGGLMNDIGQGFRENRDNGFSIDNYGQNTLADGRPKGLAYKIGEGLGSLARIAESPLGRGLITAGLVGATGGSGLEALAYGGQAGALNQQNRTRDRMYRNDLIRTQQDILKANPDFAKLTPEEQQAALDEVATSINGLRGYMTDDIYKNQINSQQIRDNAMYKRMYLDNQIKQNELTQQLRKDQLAYQKQKDKEDRAFKNAQLGLDYSKLNSDNYYNQQSLDLKRKQMQAKNTQDKTTLGKMGDIAAIEQQLNNFSKTFKSLPGKLNTNTLGNLAEWTGLQGKQQAQFNSQRTLLFNKIARDLGGEKGVLSDQDIKRIENSLPKWTDSYDQKQAKMNAIYDLLAIQKARYNTNLQMSNNQSNNEGWAF